MREPVSIRHLILYGLLTCYALPVTLIFVCRLAGYDGIDVGRAAVLYVAPVIGFFGTLVWCIRFAPSEPARTRLALIVVFIASVIAFFAFTFPVFGRSA